MTDLNIANWSRSSNGKTAYPKASGVYALFLKEGATIPGVRSAHFGVIYIGMAQEKRGLYARCHFKGNTGSHSPRRSLSALLADEIGLQPLLISKRSGTTTFKLDKLSEHALDQWMEQNLSVAVQLQDNPVNYERELIRRWEPPLNCDMKVCPLNTQQHFVLERRGAFKAMAE